MISQRKLLRILAGVGHKISIVTLRKYIGKELCQDDVQQNGIRTPYYDESIIPEITTANTLLNRKLFGYKSREVAIARYIYLHRKAYGLNVDTQLPSWQDIKHAAKIVFPLCKIENMKIIFNSRCQSLPYDMISVYADYKRIFKIKEMIIYDADRQKYA